MTTTAVELLVQPVSEPQALVANYREVLVQQGLPLSLQFAVAAPLTWVARIHEVGSGPNVDVPMVEIARLVPPQASATEPLALGMLVYAIHLPREVHPADGLDRWMQTQGLAPLSRRERATPFGRVADVLAAPHSAPQAWRRLATFKDADVLYLIDCRLPGAAAGSAAQRQEPGLMATRHFRLLAPTGQRLAEAFEHRDAAGVGFLAPVAWSPMPVGDVPVGGAVVALSHRLGDAVIGNLIVATSPVSLPVADLEAQLLAKLRNQGIAFRALVDDRSGAADQAPWRRREVTADQDGASLRVISYQRQWATRSVVVVLVSPAPERNMEAWAINVRALDVLLSSMTLR